jgi:hypothetical protein
MTIGQAYGTLGLDASSTTPDEARSRFRDLIRLHHPDGKPSGEQALANEATRVIVEACTLLRMTGFPRPATGSSGAETSGPRYERATVSEPQSADPVAWVDDVWRECIRGNLGDIASPAFTVRCALGAWTVGWQFIWGGCRLR